MHAKAECTFPRPVFPPLQVEKTTVKKNTLNPVWNERLWLLVQEPSTQAAFITVNDVDFINLKELFK